MKKPIELSNISKYLVIYPEEKQRKEQLESTEEVQALNPDHENAAAKTTKTKFSGRITTKPHHAPGATGFQKSPNRFSSKW